MANRLFKQFFYSLTNNLVGLHGSITFGVPVAATLVNQGVTYLADVLGDEGNAITIALTSGGTAGAEVVTVTGNAISVQIEVGVTTRTQLKTAIDASAPASALISVSVTSGGTAVAAVLAATNLAGGTDDISDLSMKGVTSVNKLAAGEYVITLDDSYQELLSAQFTLQAATPVDLVPQIESADVLSAKTIKVNLMAGATPTDPAADVKLYMALRLRNSSVS